MIDKQKKIFIDTEADQYFQRNGSDSATPNSDYTFLGEYVQPHFKSLEVGCGDGRNSLIFTKSSNSQYFGVDPSKLAIETAKTRFAHHHFSIGTADDLAFADHTFDFIYLGFFLYITDRELLPKIVSEVNRCLKPNGYLAITDFSPPSSQVKKYKHHNDVLTYKFNHETLFTAFPQYKLLEKKPHHPETLADENSWTATSVLIKRDLAKLYTLEASDK